MKMTFRWYGEKDPITLEKIKQIPVVEGIVTAFFDLKIGSVVPLANMLAIKKKIEDYGFEFSVLESINVHEDIKLGRENSRDLYIDNYCASIENMGKAGIKTLCYNFMPIFDWFRSDLKYELEDNSNCLAYKQRELDNIDILNDLANSDLPAWVSYDYDELKSLLQAYEKVDENQLWKNLEYFLKRVIPVAESAGVKMAIHPDDPPWSIFNLPRIIKNLASFKRVVEIIDSPSNGVTLCSGSMGGSRDNNMPHIALEMAQRKRVNFAHIRNISYDEGVDFHEVAHPSKSGSLDLYQIVKNLYDNGFDGAIRPDHGRMIWDEQGIPGYGLYDRALGAMYIYGLYEAINKNSKRVEV